MSRPPSSESDPVNDAALEPTAVTVRDLRKVFPIRGRKSKAEVVAVDGVSFVVPPGGSLGIVGESGSGKTTIAKMLAGLERPTSGVIEVAGRDRSTPVRKVAERRRRGHELQMVFQDPYTSLDPRQSVRGCLDEVLRLHTSLDSAARGARIAELLEWVGLHERHARVLPRDLSGGQRQRVAIARAMASEPSVIVLDEAVSALDVSIQAQVLNLFNDVRVRTNVAYVFITHNLAVVRQVAEDVMVLQGGRVVEQGPTARVLDDPEDDYTRRLLASVPKPGWNPHLTRRSRRRPTALSAGAQPSNHTDAQA